MVLKADWKEKSYLLCECLVLEPEPCDFPDKPLPLEDGFQ